MVSGGRANFRRGAAMTIVGSKWYSLGLLLFAEVVAMSLWFVSAAILPDMIREVDISPFQQAALSSGVQAGFVVGALTSAYFGIPDRLDPRFVFAASAIAAAAANAVLLIASPDSATAVAARFLTGALLAGVYPVGMKIAVGWGKEDRGFLVGALVGALTLGNAMPYLISYAGGVDWRFTVWVASIAACVGGLVVLFAKTGPYHGVASRFDPSVVTEAWTNRRVRLAYAGYLGHMWELFSMWAWIAAATSASYAMRMPAPEAAQLAKITAFTVIAAGAVSCVYAGRVADRIGKAEVTIVAMAVSGASAIASGLAFGGPIWLMFAIVVVWGIAVIPDSAQFSALVADASRPDHAGSLMTLQTALGFALTFATVQLTPVAAAKFGWPLVLAALAIGPALGIVAMMRLRAMGPDPNA